MPDSTPGVPLSKLGSTNALVLASHEPLVRDLVCESLLRAVEMGDEVFELSPLDLVRYGIRDPVRLFVKDEPHAEKKFRSGKMRLISGVSLRDQLKERVLGRIQNSHEIAEWETCPSKPGIGLDDDGLLAMADTFSSMLSRGGLCATDVSGWDWSVQGWELWADAECRYRLARGAGDLYHFLLRVQAYCVANSVFVLPDGRMISQDIPGVQLSGSYFTSSSNSRMRVLASLVARLQAGHRLSGPLDIVAMGDDCVEKLMEGVKEELEKLGHVTKDAVVWRKLEGISFCSHVWHKEGLAHPESPLKTLCRYFSHPPNSASYLDWYTQLMWVFRHQPELDAIKRYAFARAGRANGTCAEPES